MDIDANILNKILAKESKQYSGNSRLVLQRKMNDSHTNIMKGKKDMMVSKKKDETQHPFMINKSQKTRNKREFPQSEKGHLQKSYK